MLGNITTSIEDKANDAVQYLLRQRDIAVETKPTYLGTKYEFYIYGMNGQVTVVGEAKIRVSVRTMRKIARKIEEAMRTMPRNSLGRLLRSIRGTTRVVLGFLVL